MKMRMANILKDAGAAKNLLAVQHGLRHQSGPLLPSLPILLCMMTDSFSSSGCLAEK